MGPRAQPFPSYTLSDASLFENIVTKEEIAQNEQFLLLPQCFPLLVIGYPFNYRDFLFFEKNMFKVVCNFFSFFGTGILEWQNRCSDIWAGQFQALSHPQ